VPNIWKFWERVTHPVKMDLVAKEARVCLAPRIKQNKNKNKTKQINKFKLRREQRHKKKGWLVRPVLKLFSGPLKTMVFMSQGPWLPWAKIYIVL